MNPTVSPGDPITAVVKGRLLRGFVRQAAPDMFSWAPGKHELSPIYVMGLDHESITWCRGHISREAAAPLLAAAALAAID